MESVSTVGSTVIPVVEDYSNSCSRKQEMSVRVGLIIILGRCALVVRSDDCVTIR